MIESGGVGGLTTVVKQRRKEALSPFDLVNQTMTIVAENEQKRREKARM